MTQPEIITLYTLEEARKIIFHSYITSIKNVLKTAVSTALVIALGIAVMYLIEGPIGIFTIILGLDYIYKI